MTIKESNEDNMTTLVGEVHTGVENINVYSNSSAPESAILLEVTAPDNLPEGYRLQVNVPQSDRVCTVIVPEGGVSAGQTFTAKIEDSNNNSVGNDSNVARIVVGQWKDGICDCCIHGCVHPMVWNACCCPFIALGQVMTRLNLRWRGKPGTAEQVSKTFSTTLGITVSVMLLNWLLVTIMMNEIDYEGGDYEDTVTVSGLYVFSFWLRRLVNFCYTVTLVFLMTVTRGYIRSRYNIQGNEVEDCCLSFWCTCCTVSQMARHTTDYELYSGKLCTPTGLAPDTPPIDGVSSGGEAGTPIMEATIV